MKNLLLILLITLFTSHIKAQDINFNKYLSPFEGSLSIDNLIKTDSCYYGFFSQVTADRRQNYGLLKLNKKGEIIDSSLFNIDQKYKISYFPSAHGFIATKDSNLLACGTILRTTGVNNSLLVKFNNKLDTLWTKEYQHPDTLAFIQNPTTARMEFTDVKETPDGGYIIVGNYNKNCIGKLNRAFLIKTDSNGDIESYYSNNFKSRVYDIEITKDSGYVYLVSYGHLYNLIKANKYGETEWKYRLSNTNKIFMMSKEITFLNDSIIAIGSPYFSELYDPIWLDIGMFNINSRKLIWRNDYRLFYSFQNITLQHSMNIDIAKDSNIIVSGTSIIDKIYEGRGAILKLNQNGDSLWSKYYAHNNDDTTDNVQMQLCDLIICDDGGFLFSGFAFDNDNKNGNYLNFSKAWLVKTDSMGMTKGAFTTGIENNTLVIKKQKPLLYPNPAIDNFNLRFEQSPTENYELSIYSSSGVLVKQKQLSAFGNEYRVNIQELKSGVYFVRLAAGGEMVYSSKFIKQ